MLQPTYLCGSFRQSEEGDLVKGAENYLHYFGGVPQVIVPDNLRSAVTRGSNYEAIINVEFSNFAEHYGMVVLTARVYKPREVTR